MENNFKYIKKATPETLAELWAKADERRKRLLNTESDYTGFGGGKIYYVSARGDDSCDGLSEKSAIRTLKAVNALALEAGDMVLFERGCEWNEKIPLELRNGVVYSAYGTGKKPAICCYVQATGGENWKSVGENLWVYSGEFCSKYNDDYKNDTTLPGSYIVSGKFDFTPSNNDVGNIIVRKGELEGWGAKITKFTRTDFSVDIGTVDLGDFGKVTRHKEPFVGQKDLCQNLEFYHNDVESRLYLYYDKGNPGEAFDDIRLCILGFLAVKGTDDIVLDNIEFSYTGGHSVCLNGIKNFIIRNCAFMWIGGSIQAYELWGARDQAPVRYGNAFQNWGDCDHYYMNNNYVYQVYDTAGGSQIMTDPRRQSVLMLDIQYHGNLFECCIAGVEDWLGMPENRRREDYKIELYVEDNIIVNGGYGFGQTRWNKGGNAFGINEFCKGDATKNLIMNIIPNGYVVEWDGAVGVENALNMYGNTIVIEYGMNFIGKSHTKGPSPYTDEFIDKALKEKILGENEFLCF